MRIVVSNPDAMGDLILRQPLFAALTEAGHALLLLVRSELTDFARWLCPAARVLSIPVNPYEPDTFADADGLSEVFAKVRDFGPEQLVLAPWSWTEFEEHLAAALADTPTIGFAGQLYFNPARRSRIAFAVQVKADARLPESQKNLLLAEQLLGRRDHWARPMLRATAEQLDRARAALQDVELGENSYWIASIGEDASNRGSHLRNWTAQRWAAAIQHAHARHGWRFLLVGNAAEQEFSRHVCREVGHGAAVCLPPEPGGSLDPLIGLTALACGYFGRDTGPMHLAAALGKPVLAVFGGGTWPQFTPLAETAVAVTVDVPCAGCGWNCHFSDSYCVKEVPVGAVTEAMDDLAADRVRGSVVRMQTRPDSARAAMEREAAARLHDHRIELETLQQQLGEVHREAARENERRTHSETRLAQLNADNARSQQHIAEMDVKLHHASAQAESAQAHVTQLLALLQQAHQQQANFQGQRDAARAECVAKQHEMESLKQSHEAQCAALRAEWAAESARLAVAKAQITELLNSRWRKIGRKLRLAGPASFEPV